MNFCKISANMEKLDEIMRLIEETLDQGRCTEKIRHQILISAEEIFTNIVSYAYECEDGEVTVFCELCDPMTVPTVRIEFRDGGTPYNPLERPDPDFNVPFEERRIGGLGIYMVKTFMDHVSYRYEDGCNILTMEKKL